MTLGQQSTAVFLVTVALYLFGGGILIAKAMPIRAGVLMTLVSFLPLTWQFTFTDSDAKGFGILLIMMLPLALAVVLGGVVTCLYELLTRDRNRPGNGVG